MSAHGRKTEYVTIPAEWGGRDAGKTYKITEMPAAQGEWWATRVMILFSGSGYEIPLDVAGRGMEAIALVGWNTIMRTKIDPGALKPLFDELMTCVQMVPDPKTADRMTGAPVAHELMPDDIEEIGTRFWLKSEVVRVHVGFSPADALSAALKLVMTKVEQEPSSTT